MVGVEKPSRPVPSRAARALAGRASLPHLAAEIFKNCQKDRRFVLKVEVYSALGYLRRIGNVINGSLAISVLGEQLQSRQHDSIWPGRTTVPAPGFFSLSLFHCYTIQQHGVYQRRLYGILRARECGFSRVYANNPNGGLGSLMHHACTKRVNRLYRGDSVHSFLNPLSPL